MIYGATNYPIKPIEDEIRELASLGFDYLELCLDPPNGYPEAVDVSSIKLVADNEGLAISVGHLPTFVWLADAYESIRQASIMETIRALDLLVEFEVKKAVLHPGYITGLARVAPDRAMALCMDSIEAVLSAAEKRGITICLENMFPRTGLFFTPEEFEKALSDKSNLMMTLDMGHARINASKKRLFDFIDNSAKRIGHLHVSDNQGREDEHLPVGAGVVDIAKALAKLKEQGYDDTLTLEVFSPDRRYLKMSLEKVKALWQGQ